jgi:ABC-type multidrug transport system fused ATPase/permease subunit
MLANRTRILVTHQTFLLSEVDTVVLLEDGRVRFVGKHDELLARKDLDLGSLLEQAAHSEELKRREEAARKAAVEAAAPPPPPGGQHPPPPPAAHHAVSSSSDGSQSGAVVPLLQPVHRESTEPEERPQPRLLTRGSVAQLTAEADAKREKNIIQEEDRAVGNIGWSVYRDFFRSAHSLLYIVAVTVALVLGQASVVMGDWFLAFWSSKEYDEQQRRWYVGVYAALTGTIIVFALLRAVLFFRLVMSCAYSLHNGMFTGVLYAPMQFFESNPVGRILNRFTKDQSIVDELMPGVFFECVQSVLMVLGALLVVIVVNVYTLIAMVPVCLLFAWVRVQYLASSREIKRLDAVSRSPVYALFSSTLSGLVTVRGFKMSEMVSRDFMSKVDANTRAYLGYLVVVRWLGIRLDIVSLAVVYSTGLFAVFASDSVSAGQVAFSLTYATSLTALLQWAVRQSAELENQMTSVERILAYSRLPPEGERHIPDSLPDPSWPSEGAVEIRSLKLRYRPELDLVLKGLSVSIPPRCKVGVCGRTGAGKSSLFATFFRLVEPCEGTIVIDGVDTRRIGLSDLRSKLAIIPQNPVIYSGSLKYNLDPFNQCSNDQLWDALRAVQLFDMVRALPDGLHTAMAEFGSNFSQGEAQLVCVARALLKPSRILLVDEATASVDGETDRVIQKVLRERFRDRTVITIAHRLNTIM